jgi:hypothetical protein
MKIVSIFLAAVLLAVCIEDMLNSKQYGRH